jgi:hypothetical protein
MDISKLSFWRWFFRGGGKGGRPGLFRFWSWWLLAHALVGAALAVLVKADLQTAAKAVLLPLAGIFVGLSFAWAGNAQALLQSPEMEEIAKHHEGGFAEYAFVFQTAILTILVALVLWGFAGLGIFDAHLPAAEYPIAYGVLKGILFAASSLTLRECWHVVLGAQWMLLVQEEIKKARKTKSKNDEEPLQ